MEVQIRRDDFGLEVSLIFNDEEVGHITLEKDIRGDEYTIIDANISPRFRGRGLYQRAILKLLKEMPSIKINSVFRSPEAERAWVSLLKKLPSKVKVEKIPLVREKTILYQLSLTEQAKLRIEFSKVIKEENEVMPVKIYSDGGGSDNAAEYEGKVVLIPISDVLPNEPFKDLSYMENSKIIKLMIKSINSGKKLPPIKVVQHPYDSTKFLVVDGNHRRYAFSKSEKEYVDAVIIPHDRVLLMKNKWGEQPEDSIRLTDVIDDKQIIDRYFVKPDSTNSFEKSDTQSEVKEGEITERCWKGYTQKGMKTMFGKRYPNCVKKKKMNESTPLLFKRIIPNMEETINTVIKSLIKTLSSKKICNYFSTSEDFRDSIINGAMRVLGNEFLVNKNLSDNDSAKIREELLFYMRTKYSGKIFLLYEIMCG